MTQDNMQQASRLGFNPLADVALVVMFLTRIPVGWQVHPDRTLASAAWAFPLAGLIVGGAGGGVLYGAALLGLPLMLCAVLGLCVAVLLSGALHEDGLADVVDGFGGGMSRERKLEIMRDSAIGSYGTLAIVFSIAIRVAALAAMPTASIAMVSYILAATFSRALLPALMTAMSNARTDGLSAAAGRPHIMGAGMAFLLGCGAIGFVLQAAWLSGAIAALASVVAILMMGIIARRQIGGQTGDVIGAAQQLGEAAFLVAMAVLMGGAV